MSPQSKLQKVALMLQVLDRIEQQREELRQVAMQLLSDLEQPQDQPVQE